MPRQFFSHHSQQTEERTTALVDTRRDGRNGPGHRERLRSSVRRQPPYARTVPLPEPLLDGHPRGHVVGHRIGDPPPPSLDGHPRGHVVGHRIGDPPPPSLDGHPRGHVIGHRVGVSAARALRATYRKVA
jgi:hypothetical protein